ncbi:DinB family protein [Tsukamurella serpentis]
MPFLAPAADTERAGYRGFLVQQLDALRHTAFGLTEEQIRLAPARSALTVGGLIKHVTVVLDGWCSRAEAAPESATENTGSDEGFDLTDTDTLESLLAAYDTAGDRALALVDTADLDLLAPVPEAPWFPKDLEGWSIRWILLHLIEEVARHAGHADIVREQIDGATMYELVAAAEDMGDLGFVQPWTPPQP